jgi:hypothetical protein
MRRVTILLTTTFAAAAAAGTLPNAGEPEVFRFAPFASGLFDAYGREYAVGFYNYDERGTRWGGGGGFWAQYDGTWTGAAMRFGAAGLGAPDTAKIIDWEFEYYLYLLKGSWRPMISGSFGVGHAVNEYDTGVIGPFAVFAGVRRNAARSPSYVSFGAGYKLVIGNDYEAGHRITARGNYYFGLTDTLAFCAAVTVEGGKVDYTKSNDQYNETRWRVRIDAGPSWAF